MPRSLHTAALVGCFVLLVTLLPVAARSAPADPPAPVAEAPAQPLTFVENVGQFAPGARFALQGAGGTLFAADDAIWLAQAPKDEQSRGANIRLSFAGAALHPQLEPFGRLDQQISYFRGSRERWRSAVPTWSGVRYRDLYPGVDLELTGADGRLAPRLVARSSADLTAVRLQIDGADAVALDAQAIHLQTAAGPIALPLFSAATPGGTPLLPLGGARPSLHGSTVQLPVAASAAPAAASAPAANNDDSLIYSTYLGGSAVDIGTAIATDANGFAYVAGDTYSLDLPTSPGAFDPGDLKYRDVFIIKFQPGIKTFVYETFLGGSHEDDHSRSIAVDTAGNAYVTGFTYADDFPTTQGAFDRTCGTNGECIPVPNALGDIFVTKLNSTGTDLFYSTYIGGNEHDAAYDIAIDASGSAYITGKTESSSFPLASGSLHGASDAYVAKLNPAGSSLLYSRYIGGSGKENDQVAYEDLYTTTLVISPTSSIAVEPNGTAYVVGTTDSPDFPASIGSGAANNIDTFLLKLAAGTGETLLSRLYGGDGIDFGKDIALSPSGVYIVGSANNPNNFPSAGTPYDSSFDGGTDAFLLKLGKTSGEVAYSSWLGGNGLECVEMCALALGPNSDIVITGDTGSNDFPTTSNAYLREYNDSNDIFVARIAANGQNLVYGTYIGSPKEGNISKQDYAFGIALDSSANAMVVGMTNANNFPITENALFGAGRGGLEDAFMLVVATQTTYSIRGFVLNKAKKGLEGAIVRDNAGHAATTDSNGEYILRGLLARNYTIQASKIGYTFTPLSLSVTTPTNTTFNFIGTPSKIYVPIAQKSPQAPPEICPNDKYETNNDDRSNVGSLPLLTAGISINAAICFKEEHIGNSLRQDNYRIKAPPGSKTMVVSITNLSLIVKNTNDSAIVVYNASNTNQPIEGCFWTKPAEITSPRTCNN